MCAANRLKLCLMKKLLNIISEFLVCKMGCSFPQGPNRVCGVQLVSTTPLWCLAEVEETSGEASSSSPVYDDFATRLPTCMSRQMVDEVRGCHTHTHAHTRTHTHALTHMHTHACTHTSLFPLLLSLPLSSA